MKNMACVILAAGLGTRMKSSIPKALHELESRPMLGHIVDAVKGAGIDRIALVLGHGSDGIKKEFNDVDHITQKKQLGSGDAVNAAKNYFKNYSGDILVLYSDTPLLKSETLKRLIDRHRADNNGCTILTANVKDPSGYGRIIRNASGQVIKIIEEKDASIYDEAIGEINVGVYAVKKELLFGALEKIKLNKKKKEYYLTDIVEILRKSKAKISSLLLEDLSESFGVNSRVELAMANEILAGRAHKAFMAGGVTIVSPATTHIDSAAKIGRDTIIYPNTIIEKDVEIGSNCRIGPFAHLRPGTRISSGVEIGNFTELVRTNVGKGCKIKHKTYLGDTVVGSNVNVGAGTITANYDGSKKHRTVIGDNVFLGVGCILIAPVKIGKDSTVGAGSVVTKGHDVPDGSTVCGVPARIMRRKK